MRAGPDCEKLSTLLNGIDVPRCEAAVTTELTTGSGTILLNGLPKDAPLVISAYLTARMVTPIIAPDSRLSSFPF
jgi:hypothetical protein